MKSSKLKLEAIAKLYQSSHKNLAYKRPLKFSAPESLKKPLLKLDGIGFVDNRPFPD